MEDQEISYSSPFGSGGLTVTTNSNDKEVIVNCSPITVHEMKILEGALQQAEDNQVRIEIITDNKEGKLFSCDQILAICKSTPSLKTRKMFLHMLGPRVTDVKNSASILALFSASSDKSEIEEIFRTVSTMKMSKKIASSPANGRSPVATGGRGAGGRGGRGRLGNAVSKVMMANRAVGAMKKGPKTSPTATPPVTPKQQKVETPKPLDSNSNSNKQNETLEDNKTNLKQKEIEKDIKTNNSNANQLEDQDNVSPFPSPLSSYTTPSSTISSTSSSSIGQAFFPPKNNKSDNSLNLSHKIDDNQSASNSTISESSSEKGQLDTSTEKEKSKDNDRNDINIDSETLKQKEQQMKKELRRARSSIRTSLSISNPLSFLGSSPRDSLSKSNSSSSFPSLSSLGSPTNSSNHKRVSKRKSRYILSGSLSGSLTNMNILETSKEESNDDSPKDSHIMSSSSRVIDSDSSGNKKEKEEDQQPKEESPSAPSPNSFTSMNSLFQNVEVEGEKDTASKGLSKSSSLFLNLNSNGNYNKEQDKLNNEESHERKSLEEVPNPIPNAIPNAITNADPNPSGNPNANGKRNPKPEPVVGTRIRSSSSSPSGQNRQSIGLATTVEAEYKRPSLFINSKAPEDQKSKDVKVIEERVARINSPNSQTRLKELIEVDVQGRDIHTNHLFHDDNEITTFFSLQEIMDIKARKDFSLARPHQLEKYLSDEEFSSVFGMTKDDFENLAAWKRKKIKQEKGLF